jgi:hypothetical protein
MQSDSVGESEFVRRFFNRSYYEHQQMDWDQIINPYVPSRDVVGYIERAQDMHKPMQEFMKTLHSSELYFMLDSINMAPMFIQKPAGEWIHAVDTFARMYLGPLFEDVTVRKFRNYAFEVIGLPYQYLAYVSDNIRIALTERDGPSHWHSCPMPARRMRGICDDATSEDR